MYKKILLTLFLSIITHATLHSTSEQPIKITLHFKKTPLLWLLYKKDENYTKDAFKKEHINKIDLSALNRSLKVRQASFEDSSVEGKTIEVTLGYTKNYETIDDDIAYSFCPSDLEVDFYGYKDGDEIAKDMPNIFNHLYTNGKVISITSEEYVDKYNDFGINFFLKGYNKKQQQVSNSKTPWGYIVGTGLAAGIVGVGIGWMLKGSKQE